MGDFLLNKKELLENVYKSIDWSRLYELAPEIERDDVDALFMRVRETLSPGREASLSPPEVPLPPADASGVILYCDGASRGNPGPAGVGVVIENGVGVEQACWGKSIGTATNNAAEYLALIEGLERAKEMGIKEVEVRTDSQLMARQISGRYRVKSNSLRPLFREARELLDTFDSWKIRHVDRENNKKADKLASQYAEKS